MRRRTEQEPKQKTQPKKGEPVEIPVPTREEWLRNLEKIAPAVEKDKRAE